MKAIVVTGCHDCPVTREGLDVWCWKMEEFVNQWINKKTFPPKCPIKNIRMMIDEKNDVKITIEETGEKNMEYFVDAINGTNHNDGTERAKPWKTLKYALEMVNNNDIINLVQGEYVIGCMNNPYIPHRIIIRVIA